MIWCLILFAMGLTITLMMVRYSYIALRHGRVRWGRGGVAWVHKAENPQLYRINLIINLVLIPVGVWMMMLAASAL